MNNMTVKVLLKLAVEILFAICLVIFLAIAVMDSWL